MLLYHVNILTTRHSILKDYVKIILKKISSNKFICLQLLCVSQHLKKCAPTLQILLTTDHGICKHSPQGGQMTTLYAMLFLPTSLFLSFIFNDCQMLRLCSDTDGEKTLVLEETTLPVPLNPPQILHGLAQV